MPAKRLGSRSTNLVRDVTRENLLWLAGLLEGEGSFIIHKRHPTDPAPTLPRIQLGMQDPDVVYRAAHIFGVAVTILKQRPGENRPIYRCIISTAPAIGWMFMLFPFMGRRRKQQIKRVLTCWSAVPATPSHVWGHARYKV